MNQMRIVAIYHHIIHDDLILQTISRRLTRLQSAKLIR